MKKLLLLATAGLIVSTADAQQAVSSVVKTDNVNSNYLPAGVSGQDLFKEAAALRPQASTANKTTASGTRLYNYVEALALTNTQIVNNDVAPYMWRRPNMYGIYSSSTGGTERDTITFSSYASILQPWFPLFNDEAFPNATIAITAGNAYTVDSVAVYGFYGRNPNKTSFVDTLRIALAYGASVRTNTFTGNDIQTNFGVPSITVPGLYYDTAKGIATQGGGGPAVIVRDVLLEAADTGATGVDRFAVHFGQNIPAGSLVGVSVTFLSGENYTPWDTVFLGSTAPFAFKYGMFRPIVFEENNSGYPTYTAGNMNGGAFKFLPDNGNGWLTSYVPGAAYLAAEWPYELPYVDWVISANNVPALSVANVSQKIATNAYPNPATSEVKITFTLDNVADATVNVTNTVGQVVKTQSFSNVSSGQATFSTSDLANGVYMYTVEANGQRQTGRVVVSH